LHFSDAAGPLSAVGRGTSEISSSNGDNSFFFTFRQS
jgi:hypothetical protein